MFYLALKFFHYCHSEERFTCMLLNDTITQIRFVLFCFFTQCSIMSQFDYNEVLTDSCEFDTQVLISAPVQSGRHAGTTRCIPCGGKLLKM